MIIAPVLKCYVSYSKTDVLNSGLVPEIFRKGRMWERKSQSSLLWTFSGTFPVSQKISVSEPMRECSKRKLPDRCLCAVNKNISFPQQNLFVMSCLPHVSVVVRTRAISCCVLHVKDKLWKMSRHSLSFPYVWNGLSERNSVTRIRLDLCCWQESLHYVNMLLEDWRI